MTADPRPNSVPSGMETGPVSTVIVPRARDLGGFEVRRALPSRERQMIGPFIFFDQMGPTEFRSGHGVNVRPHPHINLATVTYLFEGEIIHRDSLGTLQPIRPAGSTQGWSGPLVVTVRPRFEGIESAKLSTHENHP